MERTKELIKALENPLFPRRAVFRGWERTVLITASVSLVNCAKDGD